MLKSARNEKLGLENTTLSNRILEFQKFIKLMNLRMFEIPPSSHFIFKYLLSENLTGETEFCVNKSISELSKRGEIPIKY